MRRLFYDRRGSAGIEFALISLFFFGVMSVGLDIGMYVQQKLRLGAAVEQGALMAFNTRDAVTPANIKNYVQAAAGTKATPTAAVTCNQDAPCVNTNRTCACYTAATKSFASAASCTATCPDGALSGYYLKIDASLVYRPIVVPNRFLNGTVMHQVAVVRLQ